MNQIDLTPMAIHSLTADLIKSRLLLNALLPSFPDYLAKLLSTQHIYTEGKALISPDGHSIKSGDMAAVPEEIYNIMIKDTKCDIELFAGALNHHWQASAWFTAEPSDQFWGGIPNAFHLKTWVQANRHMVD